MVAFDGWTTEEQFKYISDTNFLEKGIKGGIREQALKDERDRLDIIEKRLKSKEKELKAKEEEISKKEKELKKLFPAQYRINSIE